MSDTSVSAERSVYLIREGDRYKIGQSKHPQTRLRQVAGPDATLLHSFPSAMPLVVERALHFRFKESLVSRRSREWFYLTEEDVAAIRAIARADRVEDLPEQLRPRPEDHARRQQAKARRQQEVRERYRHLMVRGDAELIDAFKALARRNRRYPGQELLLAMEAYLRSSGKLAPAS